MMKYMRSSVILVIGLSFLLFCYFGEYGPSRHRIKNLESSPEEQLYRTSFHFQPPKNWMNDPTGPMLYKGVYHFFFQYNPYGAYWGNLSWAHSISYDLINWVHLDVAMSPSETYDINGCWSGSATFLSDGNIAILYTGLDAQNQEIQNLAIPKDLSDPLLIEWVKSPNNPLMTPPSGVEPNKFRDPTTAWQGPDKIWRVLVGSEMNGHGIAFLYKSKDFITWSKSHSPFHFSKKTNMWECPDFFPVSVNDMYGVDLSTQDEVLTRHVLKASFNSHDYYVMGKYVHKTDKFVVENDFMDDAGSSLRFDYGKFYASKSFFDSAKKRRVLWGWINESDSESDAIKRGWSGLQAIPRSVLLSKNEKQLILWPIEEIEQLRANQVTYDSKNLEGGSKFQILNITASQADIEVSFDIPNLNKAEKMDSSWDDPQLLCSHKNAYFKGEVGPFGILALASEDLKEQTAIFFRVFKNHDKFIVLMCSDQSRSSLREGIDKTTYGAFIDLDPRSEKISLRSLIDHSVIESFGGEGKACITARVYPNIAINKESHLYVFNSGTESVTISKLNAWSMRKAHMVSSTKSRKSHIN